MVKNGGSLDDKSKAVYEIRSMGCRPKEAVCLVNESLSIDSSPNLFPESWGKINSFSSRMIPEFIEFIHLNFSVITHNLEVKIAMFQGPIGLVFKFDRKNESLPTLPEKLIKEWLTDGNF
ncbi:hypothetical protein Tco_1144579 [Tanacetum coccineum]